MIDTSVLLPQVWPAAAGSGIVGRHAGVELLFELAWRSATVTHCDCVFEPDLNLARDAVPPRLAEALRDSRAGARIAPGFATGELAPAFRDANCIAVEARQFRAPSYRNLSIRPAAGRFYPKRCIAGVKQITPGDMTPMRVTGVDAQLGIDLNHPLAARDLTLTANVIGAAAAPRAGLAGARRDIAARVTGNGPGMQARWRELPTDFWCDEPFARTDASPDAAFYAAPRFVSHIDSTAATVIGELYRQWIPRNACVLDLMASWESHLPVSLPLARLAGLGLNADELARNQRMTDYLVQDLNQDPRLPYAEETFDAVICTVSVEYLVRPQEVFAHVARVLRPGGRFIVTFSNRWFPPKAIRVWELLHDYERMGLVLEYFLLSGLFTDLKTWSMRGLPRPADDKYADRLPFSDPVYAVCGSRKTGATAGPAPPLQG